MAPTLPPQPFSQPPAVRSVKAVGCAAVGDADDPSAAPKDRMPGRFDRGLCGWIRTIPLHLEDTAGDADVTISLIRHALATRPRCGESRTR